jgi:hypothetical protein
MRRITEGLVVEARRQQRRKARAHRCQVEAQARPCVASEGLQAGAGRDVGGPRVGRARATLADVDQAGGLFHAAAEDAAGPVQLETAAYVHDALGQQGRGHGVAGKALHFAAIELKTEGLGPVDPSAMGCRQAEAAHVDPSGQAAAMP